MQQRPGIESFALGRSGKVSAWCVWKNRETGEFSCLSGGYDAIYQDGAVTHHLHDPVPMEIVWEGVVPMSQAQHYNDAIRWIEGALEHASL